MKNNIKLNSEISGLNPQQQRMLRRLNWLLVELTSLDSEEEYFTLSSEALKLCAAIIKQSTLRNAPTASYKEQALECALETLMEQVQNSVIISYDN